MLLSLVVFLQQKLEHSHSGLVGQRKAYKAARSLFSSMGKNTIYCGTSGTGSVANICNNLAMAVSMIGVSEAFVLGQSLGIKANTLTKKFDSSSARCWSRLEVLYMSSSRVSFCIPTCDLGILHMLDIPQAAEALNIVKMELVDASFPLLQVFLARLYNGKDSYFHSRTLRPHVSIDRCRSFRLCFLEVGNDSISNLQMKTMV